MTMSQTFSPSYRLIWFQHFRKAAGTTIVEAAIINGEKLYPHQKNGNPYDDQGELLPLENYSETELKQFVDQCEHKGITFVACEWDIPNYRYLANDPRVCIVACMRKPINRFNSSYYYGFYRGSHDVENILDFLEYSGNGLGNNHNYYTKLLSKKQQEKEVGEPEFETAKSLLECFDYLSVLENDGLNDLYQFLGWEKQPQKASNKTQFKWDRAIRFFFKGKSHLTKRHKSHPNVPPDLALQQKFNLHNELDNRLYDWVSSKAKNLN